MNSLTELKKIIQSINEKITDDNINTFQKQLSQFGQPYEENPIVTSFLIMMRSLGNYLGAKKNNAHTDSIPVLHSITEQLDKIINHPDIGKDETNRILSKEIKKYRFLQNKIASRPVINDKDINDLKAVILAIDWEISETTLQNFEKVVTNLLSKLKNYKLHQPFLKIIHSTGRYIGTQKANAHTDSISFLRSVFKNFEQLVQTPDMTFKDKKQILETDINRFLEFKRKISLKKKRTLSPPDISEDESIQPALSHIKTGMSAINDLVPLTTLPAQEDTKNSSDLDILSPALANKNKSPAGSRDVMEDLFNIKESPADELLDAIHLLDVHGSNQEQALNMLDRADDQKADGIKNFTPQRMDTDPIPEIGSRLDEFFNLDVSSDNVLTTDDKNEQSIEISTEVKEGPTEGIVPFQEEDESFEEVPHKRDEDKSLPQNPDSAILNRLKSTIEDSEWLRYEASMLSINEDISYLEKRWQNDPDKTCLLQIIALIIKLLKHQSEAIQQKNEDMIHDPDKAVSDTPRKQPEGLWGKIKGLFFS